MTVTDDRLGSVCTLTGSGINGLEFLAPNDTASCTATGVAQVGPYDNTGTVTAQAGLQTGAPTVTATDMSHYVGLGPVTIDVEKATNGNDADSTPLPLSVGDAVAWSYVVTNTSGEALTNVAVTDDREGVITCPLVTLPANGTMTCTPKTGVAIEGLYVNVATVTAEAADGRGGTDSDSSSYLGQPVSGGSTAVDIEKFTKGVDADSGPGPNVNVGSSVDWTYVVTNTGTTTIGFNTASGIVVIDDQGETVSCPPAMLAPLESMTCTASGTAVAGPYANVGTVEVRSLTNGQLVASDSDSSHYTGVGAAIDIEKFTNGVDADTPAEAVSIAVGAVVTWTYVVENIGPVPLSNIVVTDNQGVNVTCPQSQLGVG